MISLVSWRPGREQSNPNGRDPVKIYRTPSHAQVLNNYRNFLAVLIHSSDSTSRTPAPHPLPLPRNPINNHNFQPTHYTRTRDWTPTSISICGRHTLYLSRIGKDIKMSIGVDLILDMLVGRGEMKIKSLCGRAMLTSSRSLNQASTASHRQELREVH